LPRGDSADKRLSTYVLSGNIDTSNDIFADTSRSPVTEFKAQSIQRL